MQVFLETGRLVLRRFTGDDAGNLFDLDGDPEVMRFLGDGRPAGRATVENETLPGILRLNERFEGFGYWAAIERSSGDFLGWFAQHPSEGGGGAELGYRLRRAAWGRGYATEGSRALIRKAFAELGVRHVSAQTMAVSTTSRRVMEKAGLSPVRAFHVEWDEPIAGAEHGEVEYALTRAEWTRREAGRATDRAERPDPG